MKSKQDKTLTNGPMIPLWAFWDSLRRPSHMYQDSWGRPVEEGVKALAEWRKKGKVA